VSFEKVKTNSTPSTRQPEFAVGLQVGGGGRKAEAGVHTPSGVGRGSARSGHRFAVPHQLGVDQPMRRHAADPVTRRTSIRAGTGPPKVTSSGSLGPRPLLRSPARNPDRAQEGYRGQYTIELVSARTVNRQPHTGIPCTSCAAREESTHVVERSHHR